MKSGYKHIKSDSWEAQGFMTVRLILRLSVTKVSRANPHSKLGIYIFLSLPVVCQTQIVCLPLHTLRESS